MKTENIFSKDIFRFITAGSVDDGKSTLIGRLLYDSKSVFDDQYESIKASSAKRGNDYINLALLTDGLRAEREQGITIDVAYRYFSTPKRKFIIADTPGHIQYTRNMITGASTADLALILIDVRKGITEQTMRHTYIASLLKIQHIIVCINKMDLVEFGESAFKKIQSDYKKISEKLDFTNVLFIPVSALKGDNVVEKSVNMDWYKGPSLLQLLENIEFVNHPTDKEARFPIQYVIRPMNNEFNNYRGYAGNIAAGIFKKGESVTVLPGGLSSKISSIATGDNSLEEAGSGMSVTITLEGDLDVSRGDMIVKTGALPLITQDLQLVVCWLTDKKIQLNGKYYLKHTTKETRCIIKEIHHKININTLGKIENDITVGLNDIATISVKTTSPLVVDNYSRNRSTGSVILIDESTNNTVAAGMIV